MVETTGNFTSAELLEQEESVRLTQFDQELALDLGALAAEIGLTRELPIAISVRIGDWEVFKASLPGTIAENDGWIQRKANVVALTHHTTMYERVSAEETGSDWHTDHGVVDETHAIHGGGFPIMLKTGEHLGAFIIIGLPQVEDHLLALEILKEFINAYS
ncbi:COG4702 Uncharacterized conserved protein [Candidatus Nanopelagicaceae bacterium]